MEKLGAQRDAIAQAASARSVLDSFAIASKLVGVATDGAADERKPGRFFFQYCCSRRCSGAMVDRLAAGSSIGVPWLAKAWRAFKNKTKLNALPVTIPGVENVVCCAHKIQLVLKTVFEIPEVAAGTSYWFSLFFFFFFLAIPSLGSDFFFERSEARDEAEWCVCRVLPPIIVGRQAGRATDAARQRDHALVVCSEYAVM